MGHARAPTGFDKYHQARMRDTEYAAAYRKARAEIDAVDRLMRQLDDARAQARLSKADLARQAGTPPESVRRLLTARRSNPTLGTVIRLAGAVGLRVELTRVHGRARRRVASQGGPR
ncbi:MAG TPA: helix-turn-helix transcriptional regulator [Myxococcales bacterium]